jgi:putative transposase
MDMRSMNHQAKINEWKELIAECRGSGKSVNEWCEENTIKPSQYYYWLRTIRNEVLVLAKKPDNAPQVQFTKVSIKEEMPATNQNSSTCAVFRSGSFSLEINNGADFKVLEHILRTLGNRC